MRTLQHLNALRCHVILTAQIARQTRTDLQLAALGALRGSTFRLDGDILTGVQIPRMVRAGLLEEFLWGDTWIVGDPSGLRIHGELRPPSGPPLPLPVAWQRHGDAERATLRAESRLRAARTSAGWWGYLEVLESVPDLPSITFVRGPYAEGWWQPDVGELERHGAPREVCALLENGSHTVLDEVLITRELTLDTGCDRVRLCRRHGLEAMF